jgi:hypothetical protein
MLDIDRREFIALIGGGGLLLTLKVKRAWGQQLPRFSADPESAPPQQNRAISGGVMYLAL